MVLPFDIQNWGGIKYSTRFGKSDLARAEIANMIERHLGSLREEKPAKVVNLFRHTVELATGRQLERLLAKAFRPGPELAADLASELQRLGRTAPKLRDRTWSFLEELAKTLLADPSGRERAIEAYRLLTSLEGFRDKRRDAFYKLNEICAADPDRSEEAQYYLEEAKKLED